MENLITKIYDYYLANPDQFDEDAITCDIISYDDMWTPMDEFDDVMKGYSPMEIVLKVHNGYDEYGHDFNPNDEYFKLNGYANLVSSNRGTYINMMDKGMIKEIIEAYIEYDTEIADEVSDLIDEYQETLEENE